MLCAFVTLAVAGRAHADDFIVYSPHVVATQTEVELRGFGVSDGRSDLGGERAAELSVAHAFTGWWKPELYLAEYAREPGAGGKLVGYEFENTFQLSEPGRYWADFGLLASYGHPRDGGPGELEFGPLIEKSVGRFDHRVNLIWEKQVGAGAASRAEFRYSYAGTYAVSSAFRPGIEAYGRPADHAYQAGPIVAGEWHVPHSRGNLEYRLGLLLGLNAAAPRRTCVAQLEYEFF
ncbi:MAG: hypothetical protein KGM46_12235 [Pseudomonadota bacterium]|jgi:hypothetical protein|nr:hypothetical protein [Xanthomonadaceae bacterium]MDE2247095.1 hypothetical protein [Xanthomonadaceae bacterium]MDE3211500.1 hypothetical protein [Pseudomonadota bacterium]